MFDFNLKTGKGKVNMSITQNIKPDIISCNQEETKNEEDIIMEALKNPIGTPQLGTIVNPGEKICIVVSDITRSWQKMSKFLPFIIEELNEAGVRDEDILFLAATGSHRRHSLEEKRKLLGEKLAERFNFIDHNCRDDQNLAYLDTTSFGTPVFINKKALDCDHLILTGGIVFHELAGFAGGKKSILPGIAGYETIMANHSLSLAENFGEGIKPEVTPGNTTDNPIYQDMVEAVEMVKPSFIFNVIIGGEGKITAAVAGDCLQAHQVGCEIVEQKFSVKLEKKADLVIASCGGYPKDIDLYQASKSLLNASYALKEGGTVVLLAECIEGIGHKQVEEIIRDFNTNLEREKYLRDNFTIARYTGYLITTLVERFKTILVTELDENLLENTSIKVVKDIDSALKIVYNELNDSNNIYLMPDVSNIMPML